MEQIPRTNFTWAAEKAKISGCLCKGSLAAEPQHLLMAFRHMWSGR